MANNKWTKHFKERSVEEFEEFIKENNSKFFQLNLQNLTNTQQKAFELQQKLFVVSPFGLNQIRAAFAELSREFGDSTSSDLSISYYTFRGFSEDDAREKISHLQRLRSRRCPEYWIRKGFSEEEAKSKVSEIQVANGKKLGEKLRTDEDFRKKFSVWSADHWISRGYSQEEAKEKIKQFNPSCAEFYETSAAYEQGRKENSERVKKLWKNGVYDDKVKMIATRYTSKQEKVFFNLLCSIVGEKLIYEPFGINVRGQSDDFYYVYDAYYKSPKGIILFEYDGTYWHDIEKDEKRDELVLNLRTDIIGIIRTNDCYFYKHQIKLNEITDGIKKIESKESSRILFYEST